MLKLLIILSKLKWKIRGIRSKHFDQNEREKYLELIIDGDTRSLTKSQLHTYLSGKDYEELLSIKESLLIENNYSENIKPLLELIALQMSRTLDTYYSNMWNHGAEDIYKERKQLSNVIELLRKDILRTYRISRIEKEKYKRDADHSINLSHELSSIGSRMHQLQIEENLPKIEFPAPHLFNPNNWISKIEEIITTHDNPYLAAFYIRLKLDRIQGANIIVYILKQGKPMKGPQQFFRTYPKKEYFKRMDNLMNSVTSKKQKLERDNSIAKLKASVEITELKTFRKGLLFLIEKGILEIEPKNIDWLIYSMCSNSKKEFSEEFPANKLSFDSLDKARDFRSTIKYFYDRQTLKINHKNNFYDLMKKLMYSNTKGNSLSAWRDSLNERIIEPGKFNFYDDSIKFIDFKLSIQK